MPLDVGSPQTVTMQFTDDLGNPVTPANAALAVTQPDQTTLTPAPTVTLASPATAVITATQSGLHTLVWTSNSPAFLKTDYVNFRKYVSAVSLAESKDRLGLSQTITTNDERVRLFAGAATRQVEKLVGTLVPRQFTNEIITGTYRDALKVANGPIFMPPANSFANGSVTALSSIYPSGPSWQCGGTGNSIVVTPSPGVIREIGLIPFWYGPWQVTYIGGISEIPEPLVEAVKEVIFDYWQEMRGLTADEAAQALDALTAAPYYRLPARALAQCRGYELPGFG